MSKAPTCYNCWRSVFRNLHGCIVLYCGYYYRPVPDDGMTCDNHTYEKTEKQ